VTSIVSERDCTINNVPSPAIDSFLAAAEWYLTVRCTGSTCARLIAFQKTPFRGDNPDVRLRAIGSLSVHCPHCKALVRFDLEQIERRRIVLAH
jgi:hypothetical protein